MFDLKKMLFIGVIFLSSVATGCSLKGSPNQTMKSTDITKSIDSANQSVNKKQQLARLFVEQYDINKFMHELAKFFRVNNQKQHTHIYSEKELACIVSESSIRAVQQNLITDILRSSEFHNLKNEQIQPYLDYFNDRNFDYSNAYFQLLNKHMIYKEDLQTTEEARNLFLTNLSTRQKKVFELASDLPNQKIAQFLPHRNPESMAISENILYSALDEVETCFVQSVNNIDN